MKTNNTFVPRSQILAVSLIALILSGCGTPKAKENLGSGEPVSAMSFQEYGTEQPLQIRAVQVTSQNSRSYFETDSYRIRGELLLNKSLIPFDMGTAPMSHFYSQDDPMVLVEAQCYKSADNSEPCKSMILYVVSYGPKDDVFQSAFLMERITERSKHSEASTEDSGNAIYRVAQFKEYKNTSYDFANLEKLLGFR